MKRVFSILLALALVLTFSLVATTPVAADSGYRMVDDDGKGWVDIDTGAHDCDSTAMNVVTTIQAGIDATPDGGTLFVCPGTYGAFTVDGRTGLTIKAASAVTVQGVQVVATAYTNRDCVAFVKDSTNIVLDGLTIGPNTGQTQAKDYGVIYENSSGQINDCTVSPNTSGDMNSVAIGIWDGSDVTIDACTIEDFGRIGVFIYNSCTADILGGSIEGQVYSGAGEVCYGIEVEGAYADDTPGTGSQVTIDGVEIYNCDNTGTPSWESGGVYINGWMEYFDEDDSTVTVENCDIHDNYIGIIAVKSSLSSANFNDIYNNRVYGAESLAAHDASTAVFDATYNWWGADDGPSDCGPGSGDAASANVLFLPWACHPTTGGEAYFTPSAGVIDDLTPVSTPPDPPATFPYGMFTFKITGLSTGQEVTLTIELPGPMPIGTKWWKYHNNTWSPMDIGDDDGDNIITVALKDGRIPDDEDLVDGQITDQGGPASPTVGWGTYPVSKVRVFLPWIALLAAIAAGASLLVVRRRRAQS